MCFETIGGNEVTESRSSESVVGKWFDLCGQSDTTSGGCGSAAGKAAAMLLEQLPLCCWTCCSSGSTAAAKDVAADRQWLAPTNLLNSLSQVRVNSRLLALLRNSKRSSPSGTALPHASVPFWC